MATAGDLVTRLERDYLAGGVEQPVRLTLNGLLADDAVAMSYTASMLAPDELDLVAPGVLLQLEYELVLVTVADASAGTATIVRGVNGTVAEEHADQTLIEVAPRFPRQGIFDAVADNVVGLWPRLWRKRSIPWTVTSRDPFYAPSDFESLLSAKQTASPYRPVDVQVFEAGADNSGQLKQLWVPQANVSDVIQLTYRARFPRPSSPWDDLNDPVDGAGLLPGWERAVLIGAAVQLVSASPDFDALGAEYLSEQIQSEQVPAGRGLDIAARLRREYEMVMNNYAADLRITEPGRVEFVSY